MYPAYEELVGTYCRRSKKYCKKQKVEYNSVQGMTEVKKRVKEASDSVLEFISITDEKMRALI